MNLVQQPRLSEDQVALLRRVGEVRPAVAGQVLFREGDRGSDFIVVLSGRVTIVDHQAGAERELLTAGPRQFAAELNLLTGERLFTTAVVTEPGTVLMVPRARLQELISGDQALGELILQAVLAWREWLARRQACRSSGRGPRRRPAACWSSPDGTGSRTPCWIPTPIRRQRRSSLTLAHPARRRRS